ncbi:hypothetical protein [Paraburkholderia sediminicola]|uniref:hypothetical protein n=1 Tax=Paraburkholderia sediminicola TaxID=458836 RepID=UPI0038B6EF9A
MESLHHRSAELIDLVNRSGMREQLEQRVEAQNLEERKRLVGKLASMRKECVEVMPSLEKAVVEAQAAVVLCEQKLLAARQVAAYAQQRAYGTHCSFGEAQITSEIERLAPKFMQDAYDDLQEPIDFLSGTVRYWSHRQRVGWGFQTIDTSNVPDVLALRERCEQGQAQIKAMMYDTETPLDKQRERVAGFVQGCLALTQPQLRDDKAWLNHVERKNRATQKTA